jgi:hypothetical protein
MLISVTVPVVGYVTFDVEVDSEEEASLAALEEAEDHFEDAHLEAVESVTAKDAPVPKIVVIPPKRVEEEEESEDA